MDRRLFLSLAAAAAAEAFQKAPVGIGFLGLTHSHARAKLAVARSLPDFRVVGICESDPKVQETLRGEGIRLMTRDELLTHPEIQVIAVESPVRSHAPDGLAVLEAGKHLHLEKAPADSMAAFQKVVSAARGKGLLLQVGYMWRYNPGIVKALEAARQGWLGNIYMVRANIGNKLEADRRPEWAEFSGGVMFELGCHVIDPMVRLMGRPRNVTATLHKDGAYADSLRDNTLAVLEWDKAIGAVQSSTLEPQSSRYRAFEVHGANGHAVVRPIEQPSLVIELEKPAGPYQAGPQKIELPSYKRFVDDLTELAAAVRGERKLWTTYDEDLMVQEALLRCSGMYS
jgi:predicted dehydrogenase